MLAGHLLQAFERGLGSAAALHVKGVVALR